MKWSDFILPLSLSAAIHLGIFVAGDSSDPPKDRSRKEVSSITLKIISSVAARTPKSALALDKVPVKPVPPAPPKTLQPAAQEPKPEPKIELKKIVKPEQPGKVQKKPRVKKVKKQPVRPRPEKRINDSKPVKKAPALEAASHQPPVNASPPLKETATAVSKLDVRASAQAAAGKKIMPLVPVRIKGLVKPGYPRYCRRNNQEGTVVLAVEINELGERTDLKILRSSGYARLDKAAVKALEKASFTPAKKGGKPVKAMKRLTFTFRLEDADE
ncbi:MAG: energy transducer TonB [Deltaproteobacteria bacterium]|nr:energy transducer TonB [Deltaproteobacteria bacterium]MBW2051657.1 energy transducer TonB [Deltaproteobacteria bacterium]MBW2140230.1 energy transducer TonB [Deltaproteobacteria bacterium]